ncbi:SDR family oxidoreductase [Rhodococcus sp. D2-41]|uniref:SDR family oxidoreductase n=1 Tax=Speluncibacter jeojiensis TaxID=2710754 RepID=UPI00240FB034|nr:SDR family oxidoreductase [Rhodococcus sp. D2-41]MDG3012571.1 SDR family oxidoreductase [Rhodococcus sp. D2-41]
MRLRKRAIDGLVIAVTGGARGIGREIAAHLAAAGAQVAIGDRDGAAEAASELPGTAAGFDLDVTDTESFRTFLGAVETRFGTIDVLVNNAGVMWVGPFDEEPESATDRMLAVNLHGVIRGVRLTAPVMRARGRGQIVTIASAAARVAPPGESTYAATKHGVLGYLTGVREELRGSGVLLSAILPGVVDTELAVGTDTGTVRLLQPADVARAVVDVIERPRFEVTLPGYVGPLIRVVNLLPQVLRDPLVRRMVPDQVAAVSGSSVRTSYESQALSANHDRGAQS